MPKVMVSLPLRLFNWCKSYFWLARTRTRTSRICDFICIVLVVVLVLVLDTKMIIIFFSGLKLFSGTIFQKN